MMALLFMDGCDHYDDGQVMAKWDTSGTTITNVASGRRGGRCLFFDDTTAYWIGKIITATDVVVVGFAMKTDSGYSSGEYPIRLLEDTTVHLSIRILTDGTVQVYRGQGTTLLESSSAGAIPMNQWVYLEMKAYIHDTAGTYEVRVNGVDVVSDLGGAIDTRNGGTSGVVSVVRIGSNGGNTYIDDIYICDDAGATCNTFLGDVRIDTLFPTGNGNSSGFTGSDADQTDNYLLVDDPATSVDDDTTYVEASNTNTKDTYVMGDLPHNPPIIHAVQVCAYARGPDGAANLALVTRSNSTDYDSSAIALGNTYAVKRAIRELDPNTSAAWTPANVNAAQFGIKAVV